jgi:P pilus assembly chaperone PapD
MEVRMLGFKLFCNLKGVPILEATTTDSVSLADSKAHLTFNTEGAVHLPLRRSELNVRQQRRVVTGCGCKKDDWRQRDV